jgi:hypothetical protein
MKTIIFQTSPKDTASTFLTNAIYGLIPELSNKKIITIKTQNIIKTQNFEDYFDQLIVVKCHKEIDELIEKYKTEYELYFICSERKEINCFIDEKYRDYKNVVIFDFKELNETETNTIPIIIENISNKLNQTIIQDINIELNIELNVKKGIERIHSMNQRYEEIKHLPFTYIDDFYQIHGSHRNRSSKSTI